MLDGTPGTDVGLAGDRLTLETFERVGGIGRDLAVHVGQDDPGAVPDELGRAPKPDPAPRTGHDAPEPPQPRERPLLHPASRVQMYGEQTR